MNYLKRLTAIILAKSVSAILNLIKPGSGTALPGLITQKIYPQLFQDFAKQLEEVVVITGTNGKTTTKEILNSILEQSHKTYITNKSGSNMKRGLLSTMIKSSSLVGKLKIQNALFEIEEATLPQIAKDLNPNIIIITNLFRDQLDAYGEVNTTRKYLEQAINLSPQAKLILNGDDPLVASLAVENQNKVEFFSLPKKYREEFDYEDAKIKKLVIPQNKTTKPTKIEIDKNLHTTFTLNLINYTIKAPGYFHVYNALAAIIAAKNLNISQLNIQKGFKKFQPAFGRGEEIKYQIPIMKNQTINKEQNSKNKQIKFKILLIKNPAGFTLTLDLLSQIQRIKVLFIINDKIADGRDISWLWDAQVEKIYANHPNLLVTSGSRAKDMALRLKYAQQNKTHEKTTILTQEDIKQAIKDITQDANPGETIYVLPTYTAMNEFRKVLGKKF